MIENQNKEFFLYDKAYQLLFFLLIPLSIFAPQGITTILYLSSIFFFFEMKKQGLLRSFIPLNRNLIMGILSIPLLGLISSCWSLEKFQSFTCSSRLLLLALSSIIVFKGMATTAFQKRISHSLLMGFILGLILITFEILTQGGIGSFLRGYPIPMFKYNKSTSLLVLLLSFLIMISQQFVYNQKIRYLISFTFYSLTGYIIFQLQSDASKITFITSTLLVIILSLLSRIGQKRLLMSLVVLCFMTPFVLTKSYDHFPSVKKIIHLNLQKHSVYDRLSIWSHIQKIVSNQVPDLPYSPLRLIGGFGLNSSKIEIFRRKDRFWTSPDFSDLAIPFSKPIHYQSEGIPLHPHNFILQILLELGCLGLALFFYLMRYIVDHLYKAPFLSFNIVLISTNIIASLIISSLSYGFWQSWWLSALALTSSIAHLLRNKPT